MRSNRPSNLLVFFAATAFLAGASLLRAQVADLPLAAGLWEANVSIKYGASNVDSGPQRVCFSAGMTLGEYEAAAVQGVPGTKCEVKNKVVTRQEISYDTVCTSPQDDVKQHVDFHLTDAAHFTGTSHMTSTGKTPGRTRTMTIDKTFSAKFLAASCGSVKPMAITTPHGR